MFGILPTSRGFRIAVAVAGGGVVFWGVVGSWFLDQRVRTWTAAGVCVGLLASATVRTTMTCTTTTACTGTTACAGMTCTATACTRPMAGAGVTGTSTGAGARTTTGVYVGLRATTVGAAMA